MEIVIDSVTQDPSTYTISGDQIVFNEAKAAPSSTALDTITFDGGDRYALTTTSTDDTLDSPSFNGSSTTFNLTENTFMDHTMLKILPI